MSDVNEAPTSGAESNAATQRPATATGYEGVTQQQAQAEIKSLMADADFRKALTTANHPGNAQAREQWNYLHRAASGAAADAQGVARNSGTVAGPERVVSSNPATPADIPATPADYKINAAPLGRDRSEPVEAHEERVNVRAALHDFTRAVAHSAGFTQSDLDTIVTAWDGQQGALSKGMSAAQIDAQYDQTLTALAREHGGHDAAMARVRLANSLINSLQPDARAKAVALLRISGLGNNRTVIERLASIAQRRAVKGGAA